MKVELIETRDGSSSLFVPELNETYHSTHGALAEAEHVFIKNGIDYYIHQNQPSNINILELGFGTGLNALLTALFAEKNNPNILYHSLETFPLGEKIIETLNYTELINDDSAKDLFQKTHQAEWEKSIPITPKFNIQKINQAFQAYETEVKYDIIYYDAFAPSKQAEMWVVEIFEKLYAMMNPNAILVTYCAQGQFKRNLKAAGFAVETLPGPPRKVEMVRAGKGE